MIKKTGHLTKSRDTQNQVKIRDCPVQNGTSGKPRQTTINKNIEVETLTNFSKIASAQT